MLSEIITMRKEIYKPVIAQDKDRDVPEFGGFAPHELRQPEIRRLSSDLVGSEAFQGLRKNALRRALYFGYGVGELPPVYFPNAEHFQHVPFTNDHWLRYGNMESEDSRVRFMLERYKSRQFPEVFDAVCRDVLGNSNILQERSNQVPRVNKASTAVYEQASRQMERLKVHDDWGYSNGDQGVYQSEPFFYQISEDGGSLERRLWGGALAQITEELQQDNFRNLSSFLHLYNHVKDPITPLRSILPEQARIFTELYREIQPLVPRSIGSPEQRQSLISQLALESSFLALSKAGEIAFVVYGGHHELPYIYVDVTQLPRGEFADPRVVFDVIFGSSEKKIKGILRDAIEIGNGEAIITPITVAYSQTPFQARPELFIVDGNNRGTAVLLFNFMNFINFNMAQMYDRGSLRRFITLYDLDIEWERDLTVVFRSLSSEHIGRLLQVKPVLEQFVESKIPALLVQEPSFHTLAVKQCKGRDIVLLQPFYQAVYNDKRWSIAIPAKQQSHGRAPGNDILVSLEKVTRR